VLIYDAETVAIDDADQYLFEPIEAPSNWKDEAKIAAYIAEKRQARASKCALDVDLARIVALGYAFDDSGSVEIMVCRTEAEERVALEGFWRAAQGQRLVTFNGRSFDNPLVMRRSLYLNVRHQSLNLDRYRTGDIDLMDYLTYRGTINAHSLRFYCARFGITIDDLTTGKDIAAMVAAGDWHGVALHCEADVKATKALAARLGVLPTAKQVTANVAADGEGAF
jgi:predicted PolB exonuclease-like 3'-5' exonuclease